MADQMSVANSQITKLAQKLRAEADLWNGTDAPSYVTGGITATQHVLRSVAAELEAMVSESASTDRNATLLRDLGVALDAWMHQYASDMCDQKRVEHYLKVIYEGGGTLGYIADLRQRIKNAAPQGSEAARLGGRSAEVDSRVETLESATSVKSPVASPAVAAPVCVVADKQGD